MQESQSAKQVIGQPAEYPEYGDLSNTWCQSLKNADEFIELLYEKDTYVSGINIYETYNCGGVIRIKIKNYKDSVWETVWEAANGAEQIEHSRIFSPELRKTNFRTREVRIEVDCTVSGSYCEIDAVGIIYFFKNFSLLIKIFPTIQYLKSMGKRENFIELKILNFF